MSPEEIWKEVLREIRLRTTKDAFDRIFVGTHAVSLQNNVLAVGAAPLAREWMETRYRAIVEQVVSQIVGAPVTVQYTLNGHAAAPDYTEAEVEALQDPAEALRAEAKYVDPRAAIIKPDRVYPMTEYFRLYWVPRLGPVLAWFILALRQHGYWNKKTGEVRGTFRWSYEDAAREIGVSSDTLWRERKRECRECETPHPIVEHFILDARPVIEYSPERGKRVRVATTFKIRMDEPLTPPDEAQLTAETLAASTPRDRG